VACHFPSLPIAGLTSVEGRCKCDHEMSYFLTRSMSQMVSIQANKRRECNMKRNKKYDIS